jgi:hypothetical protein
MVQPRPIPARKVAEMASKAESRVLKWLYELERGA